MGHEEIFKAAFATPTFTAILTPDSRVNSVIAESYDVDEPFTYTLTQLWDMEVRKAHRPDKYIHYVAKPGSLRIFGIRKEGDLEFFYRVTEQRSWKDPEKYTKVIEDVRLDHKNHTAFFLGVTEATTPEGETIVAGEDQPLFHVEHSAKGTEEDPINVWSIVFLTEEKDSSLVELFEKISDPKHLRGFNEVYIRDDLGRKLTRKDGKA